MSDSSVPCGVDRGHLEVCRGPRGWSRGPKRASISDWCLARNGSRRPGSGRTFTWCGLSRTVVQSDFNMAAQSSQREQYKSWRSFWCLKMLSFASPPQSVVSLNNVLRNTCLIFNKSIITIIFHFFKLCYYFLVLWRLHIHSHLGDAGKT